MRFGSADKTSTNSGYLNSPWARTQGRFGKYLQLRCRPELGRMTLMDKTVKTRAFPDGAKSAAPQSNLTEVQERVLEIAKVNAQLEEVQKKSFEHLKTIALLQENLKQEKARTAEMAEKAVMLETKLKDLAELEAKAKKVAELEAKVKELSEVLGKISGIAATGKAG